MYTTERVGNLISMLNIVRLRVNVDSLCNHKDKNTWSTLIYTNTNDIILRDGDGKRADNSKGSYCIVVST